MLSSKSVYTDDDYISHSQIPVNGNMAFFDNVSLRINNALTLNYASSSLSRPHLSSEELPFLPTTACYRDWCGPHQQDLRAWP